MLTPTQGDLLVQQWLAGLRYIPGRYKVYSTGNRLHLGAIFPAYDVLVMDGWLPFALVTASERVADQVRSFAGHFKCVSRPSDNPEIVDFAYSGKVETLEDQAWVTFESQGVRSVMKLYCVDETWEEECLYVLGHQQETNLVQAACIMLTRGQ